MLQNKIAFITGSTRGIGRAIAFNFAQNGATLIINGRCSDNVRQLSNELKNKFHVDVHEAVFDVSNYDEVKNGFKDIYQITKKLDIVVNNAGILESSLIGMFSKDNLKNTYSTNVDAIYYILQYASRLLVRNNSGSIINLTSIMGTNGCAGQSIYSGSKAAVIGITKSLAKELADKNIRVNAIAPGFIDTDMTNSLDIKIFDKRINSIEMGRAGTADEVANTALFLASELSEYVTGQIIGVDGGMLL